MSRPEPFAGVYRVTTKLRPVPPAEVDALARDLGVPLPDGYREYVAAFGAGELCDLLRVRTPEQVREGIGPGGWERETYAGCLRDGLFDPCELTPEDLAGAVTFATTAEGDGFVCCPRFGGVLFELPRHHHVPRRFGDGLRGVVTDAVARTGHDFPFFEPEDIDRRYASFTAAPQAEEVVGEVVRRWGAAGLRRSRPVVAGGIPDLFIGPIGGRLTLYLNGGYTGLPAGSFPVAMSYDAECEAAVADFVGRVARPDGRSPVT